MATLHVACAAQGAYVPHSAAMLHSAASIAGAELRVHYLHGPQLAPREAAAIERMLAARGAAIEFHEIAPERVAGLRVVDEFTAAMWYRLFLPELVPGADRILYLDADTIVLDDIRPLWDLDLRDHYLAAVTNVFMPYHRHRPAELGLPGPEVYFNSGVLMLNLDAMRRDGCTEAMLDYARANGDRIGWPDQDTLNVVLGERRLPLHPRWNYMNAMRTRGAAKVFGRRELAEAAARPAIRHFEGPEANKPWHPSADPADRELYARHRRATPWPSTGAGAARRFWDERARDDALHAVDDRRAHGGPDDPGFWAGGDEVLDAFAELLGVEYAADEVVVDIGCGVGRVSRALAARVRRVIGIDVSGEMIARARAWNADLGNVDWIEGDGETLAGVGDASVDGCLSHVVFQHLPDPGTTLSYVREMGRVLRPGGWAAFDVSTDPAVHRPAPAPRRLLARARGRGRRWDADPAWLGSAVALPELRAAADDAGLAVERVAGEGTQFTLVLLRRTAVSS